MRMVKVAPHSQIVEVYGEEFYVPHEVKWIAISESGIASAFKNKPTYMERHETAEGRWFDYLNRDDGHIVAQFDLEGTDPRTTLFEIGGTNNGIAFEG
jgi:hypothetical protein